MTVDDFASELYRDFDWRFDEIRALKHVFTHERRKREVEDLRKSLVVILYSHFEGFCIFALEHYLTAVNQLNLTCREVTPAILAGAWDPVFRAMQQGDQKNVIFKSSLPNDDKLHRHWRRRHFVEEIEQLLSKTLIIPDGIIDSDSNLKPVVLQRNLFILGLDHTFVDPHAGTIHNLLARRNRLAHGEDRRGVPEEEYKEYESSVFEISYKLIEFLIDAFDHQKFRRNALG